MISSDTSALEEIFKTHYAYNNLYTVEIATYANENAVGTVSSAQSAYTSALNNFKVLERTTQNYVTAVGGSITTSSLRRNTYDQLLNTQAQAGEVLDEARNNLREITKWAEGSTEYMNNYLKFQSPSVSFNGESLNLERNFATKKFHLSNSSYQRTNELSISWRESDDWRVKRYHENWIDLFYDRKNDYYLSHDDPYEEGLYRTITVKLGNKQGIRFNNVIPQTTGGLNLSWSTSPTIVSHSISYYVEDWEWIDTEEEDL